MGGKLDWCEVCDDRDPHWEIVRVGDVVVSWACDEHLADVCERLQRDSEVTRLTVEDKRKRREWAQIGRDLDSIAESTP
jgi:hypothetical protein